MTAPRIAHSVACMDTTNDRFWIPSFLAMLAITNACAIWAALTYIV
jgi:hypothetical protein